MTKNSTRPLIVWLTAALVGAVGLLAQTPEIPATDPLVGVDETSLLGRPRAIEAGVMAQQRDFILRAPAAEAPEIAIRNQLVIVDEIEVGGDPEAIGLFRVRAAVGTSPEALIGAIEELEPTVVGIEPVTRASLPELDQSTMAILDQSTMAILDALMETRALTPPLGQAGPGLLGTPDDRRIKGVKIKDDGEIVFHDEKLVLHMQYDENRKRNDVRLRADFAPGCSVEFNRGTPPTVEGAGAFEFRDRKIEWEIFNNSQQPLTVSRVEVSWPSTNLGLKKIKLGEEVKQLFPPSSVSVDFTQFAEPEKREIKADDSDTLRLEFEGEANPNQAAYSVAVTFAEGPRVVSAPCSVAQHSPPTYKDNKLEWTLINTGHADVVLETVTVEWPTENGLIKKAEFNGRPILETETRFGKIFNGQDSDDRLVWTGYVDQPSAEILRVSEAQRAHKGYATVAVIDTGVDPGHWLLADALVPGYDFLRDQAGIASEVDANVDQSTMAILDDASRMPLEEEDAFQLDQSTMAILDASQFAMLSETPPPPAFGHGTMVAGVIHRVAPYASIMPLRVFDAYGHADLLDIVEAIYFAVNHGANVINMSFNVDTFSPELMRAINYATRNGVSCVASAGNHGKEKIVYPAAFGNTVGVAASSMTDEITEFSNLGNDLVTVAAPGHAVVTSFPGGGWAVASGTSFAAPWVSGVAAIFADKNGREHQPGRSDFYLANEALSHAVEVQGRGAGRAGHGRADLKQAVDKLKGGAAIGSTGLNELPYVIVVDFIEGCSVAYPPADSGSGCAAEGATQLEVDGKKVTFEITNAGFDSIQVASIQISWPAAHGDLEKVKLDGDTIFESDLTPTSTVIDSGWRDADKPEKRRIPPSETLELLFEFDEEID